MTVKVTRILFALVFLFGCKTVETYSVVVNSFTKEPVKASRKYFILPGNEGITIEDYEFIKYAKLIENILEGTGMKRGYVFEEADIAILFYVGLKIENEERIRRIPQIVRGVQASGAGTSFNDAYRSIPAIRSYTIQHTIGIEEVSKYVISVSLSCFDLEFFRKKKAERLLWETNLETTQANINVEKVIPVLISESELFIGKNFDGKIDCHANL